MKSNPYRTNVFRIGLIVAGYLLIAAAQAADVEKLVSVCGDCHGKAGASKESDIPIIGGNSVEFLENNLGYYRDGKRDCPETEYRAGEKKGEKSDMCKIVKKLNDEEIKAIADYFSQQRFIRADQTFDPALAQKGKEIHDKYCEKCHSEGGTLAEDDAGMPAGQWMPYLRQAIKAFMSGKRPIPKKMQRRLEKVHAEDVEALVNYYGSFK